MVYIKNADYKVGIALFSHSNDVFPQYFDCFVVKLASINALRLRNAYSIA